MSPGFHLVAAVLLAQAGPVAADDQLPAFPDQQSQDQWKRAEELARKGMEELLRSLELFKEGLPVYGTPFIDPNGNIVIPRKPRLTPPLGAPVPEPAPERT